MAGTSPAMTPEKWLNMIGIRSGRTLQAEVFDFALTLPFIAAERDHW
jgi:hypothetical protein